MASWTQVREGITRASTQLASGAVTSADILKSVLPRILAVADIGVRMENDHANLGAQMVTEFGEVKQKVLIHQGAIEVLTNKPAKGHGGGTRGILESKSVTNLSMLGTDKHSFRNWNDRLVNKVSNVWPGSRKITKAMMEFVDQEVGG